MLQTSTRLRPKNAAMQRFLQRIVKMTAKQHHPYVPRGRRVGMGGVKQTGMFCDFRNQTSCSKLCVILPTDDGFYSLFTSIPPSGICKSVKEWVDSIASALISFVSGASGVSNVVTGLCGWGGDAAPLTRFAGKAHLFHIRGFIRTKVICPGLQNISSP